VFRSPQRALLRAALLLSLCGAAAPPVVACGFHGGLDNSFSAMHPRSLAVAFALRDAVEAQAIPSSVFDPISPGGAGYWRAVGRLNALTALLSAGQHASESAPAQAISILFIDSGLWARIELGNNGLRLVPHTNGAHSGDVTIVTSEAALAEVLAGRLTIDAGLSLELLVVDGKGDGPRAVRGLLIESFSRSSLAGSAAPPPIQLFGPKRN
jgi:hypothetical protein